MTADEYLSQVGMIDCKIKLFQNQIENLRLMAIGTTCPSDGDRVKSSGSQDPMGNLVAKIADLSAEIISLQNKQVEILETIECLPFEQSEVLFQRYFQHRTIQQIAEDRNCTTSNIQKTKKKAFDNLKIMKRF